MINFSPFASMLYQNVVYTDAYRANTFSLINPCFPAILFLMVWFRNICHSIVYISPILKH